MTMLNTAAHRPEPATKEAPGHPERSRLAAQYLAGAERLGHIRRGSADAIVRSLCTLRGTPLAFLLAAHRRAFAADPGNGYRGDNRARAELLQGGRAFTMEPTSPALEVARRLEAGGYLRHGTAAEAAERVASGGDEERCLEALARRLAGTGEGLEIDPAPPVPLTSDQGLVRAVVEKFAGQLKPDLDLDEVARGITPHDAWQYSAQELFDEVRAQLTRCVGLHRYAGGITWQQ